MSKNRRWTVQAPDMIDLYHVVASLGDEYNLRVQFTHEFTPDYFTVVGRAYRTGNVGPDTLQFQALSRKPLQQARDPVGQMFTVAWDLYCQVSGGGATAASRGVPAGWDGRPAKRDRS